MSLDPSLAAVAASPLVALSRQAAVPADAPEVDLRDPQARALAYVNVSEVFGKNCAACQLYTGVASAKQGPCAIFPGRQVSTAGHCNAWVETSG